jgi:tetratricopeptide (TPR) repeat protein
VRRLAPALALLAACSTYSPLDSHYNRGVEFYDRGDRAEAIREYTLAIEDDPEHYRAHYNLAVCLQDLGKLDEALVNLAALRLEQGREAEALPLLERAARSDPDSGFPRSSLGSYHERKGDLARAEAEYRASVALEPAHVAGHHRLGLLLARRGDLEGAVAEFDAALDSHPDDLATLLASSEARERKGDSRGALLHLERALERARDRADLWVRLAALYEAEGRLEDAMAALWEARAVGADVKQRLASLHSRLAGRER